MAFWMMVSKVDRNAPGQRAQPRGLVLGDLADQAVVVRGFEMRAAA